MNSIFKIFRKKYRVDKKTSKPEIKDEKKEAAELSKEIAACIIMIPMLKPHENDFDTVQIPQKHIELYSQFVNTQNSTILNTEDYLTLREFLKKLIIDNENGINLDIEMICRFSRIAKRFAAKLQPDEYYKELVERKGVSFLEI